MFKSILKYSALFVSILALAACHQDDDHHHHNNSKEVSANCYHNGSKVHCDSDCYRNNRGHLVCDKD